MSTDDPNSPTVTLARENVQALMRATVALLKDAKVYGLEGEAVINDHPSVKCEVEGLTLGHWYDLRNAFYKMVGMEEEPLPLKDSSGEEAKSALSFPDPPEDGEPTL